MDTYETTRIAASLATALGVGIAAWQIWRNAEQTKTSFEDSLAKEYRELMRSVSYKALVGKAVSAEEAEQSREAIYNYLDFCNQQVYLRINKRIRCATWAEWQAGMKINLRLPLFAEVAEEVFEELPEIFSELRRVRDEEFRGDPATWS